MNQAVVNGRPFTKLHLKIYELQKECVFVNYNKKTSRILLLFCFLTPFDIPLPVRCFLAMECLLKSMRPPSNARAIF
jgi:hypothetical protein